MSQLQSSHCLTDNCCWKHQLASTDFADFLCVQIDLFCSQLVRLTLFRKGILFTKQLNKSGTKGQFLKWIPGQQWDSFLLWNIFHCWSSINLRGSLLSKYCQGYTSYPFYNVYPPFLPPSWGFLYFFSQPLGTQWKERMCRDKIRSISLKEDFPYFLY